MSVIYIGLILHMEIKATWGIRGLITDPGVRGPRIKTTLVFYQQGVLGAIYLISPRLSDLSAQEA